MRAFSLATLLLALGFAGAAQADPPAAWTKYCQKCHGADGKGQTVMGKKLNVKDMTAADWQGKHTDDAIRQRVRAGDEKAKMPKFGPDKVTDAELAEVLKFVRGMGR